jgi:hypothetical protein
MGFTGDFNGIKVVKGNVTDVDIFIKAILRQRIDSVKHFFQSCNFIHGHLLIEVEFCNGVIILDELIRGTNNDYECGE